MSKWTDLFHSCPPPEASGARRVHFEGGKLGHVALSEEERAEHNRAEYRAKQKNRENSRRYQTALRRKRRAQAHGINVLAYLGYDE